MGRGVLCVGCAGFALSENIHYYYSMNVRCLESPVLCWRRSSFEASSLIFLRLFQPNARHVLAWGRSPPGPSV